MSSLRRAVMGGVAACAMGLGCVGCATYANYPEIGNDVAVNDPNIAPLPTLETVALRWVVEKYPVKGDYVVNLARGTERGRAESIAKNVGKDARIVSSESAGLPAYHVSRIWLRGDRAEVDVMRPVGEAGAYQTVTVRLKSEFGRWVVSSAKTWPVGMGEVPDLYGWGERPAKQGSEKGGEPTSEK